MAEWESCYGGRFLSNARLLTKEEIDRKYPIENTSCMTTKLTREAIEKGFDIMYGEIINLSPNNPLHYYDVLVTAADLYKCLPEDVKVEALTDMSQSNAIYAAVKRV